MGDGFCHCWMYNEHCQYDQGDCLWNDCFANDVEDYTSKNDTIARNCLEARFNGDAFSYQPSLSQITSWISDGECDCGLDVEICNYDGGACLGKDCNPDDGLSVYGKCRGQLLSSTAWWSG